MIDLISTTTDYVGAMNGKINEFNRSQEVALIQFRRTYRNFWELDTRPDPQYLETQFRLLGKERFGRIVYASYVMAMTLKSILHDPGDGSEYLGLWQQDDERLLDFAYEINYVNGVWGGDEIVVGPIKSHWNNG